MVTAADRQSNADGQEEELLCEISQPLFSIRLWLADQRMECRIEFGRLESQPVARERVETSNPQAEETSPESVVKSKSIVNPELSTPAGLIQLLADNNITQGIDFEALYDFAASVAEGGSPPPTVLARGIKPQTGADGWFELEVKTAGDHPEFEVDARGRIDLRTLHAFTEIEAGQKIGVLHPPKDGIPGRSVVGEPLPAEHGQIIPLVAGEGVELKYNGRYAFATRDGRALLERQVLTVVDQLVVEGDLDLEVGNISFHGFVEVKGDVLDDFYIVSAKGILVRGVVGASRLESEGLIEIASMAGRERGVVICHELHAGFLNQAKVQCFGDVLVKNEIRNSNVKSTGRIIVERGGIVGGSCVALEGIEARVVGAPSGLNTSLTAGVYFPDEDRFNFLRESLNKIDAHIKRLHMAIGPLEKLEKLDDASSKRLSLLTEQWERLEIAREDLQAEVAASTRQEPSSTNPKINIGKELLPGVQILLGRSKQQFMIERKGPVSIIENSKEGGFRFLSMTPLQKTAQDLEDELLAQEAVDVSSRAEDQTSDQ